MFMEWGSVGHPFEGVSVKYDPHTNIAEQKQLRQWVKTQFRSIWTTPDPQLVRPPLDRSVEQASSNKSTALP